MQVVLISLLLLLTSCQWLLTHPEVEVEVIEVAEELMTDLYQYETKTLSPAPPQPHVQHDLPPFKPGYKP